MVHLLLAVLLPIGFAHAQDGGVSDSEMFRSQVEELNDRYENFFSRQAEQKLYLESIKRGIGELDEQRRIEMKEKAQALRAFKAEPRVKSDTTALEAEHEAGKRAHDAIHNRYRKAHVNQREQLRRISQSARKIPENQDAGLE